MHSRLTSRILLSAFCILFLISCSSPAVPTTPPPLPTEPVLPTQTSAPAATSGPGETPTVFPTITPDLPRPKYVIDLQMDYTTKAATVNQTITYPNWTGETLKDIILAVEPNLWSGGFNLKSLAIDDQSVTNFTLENMSQKLDVPLPKPLEPSRTIV